MKALVTGGAGFIGSHLCERLVADGHTVTVLDNMTNGKYSNIRAIQQHSRFRILDGDVRDPLSTWSAMAECDTVFHMAARPGVLNSVIDPWTTNENNVDGTLSVLGQARRLAVVHVVFASSSSVYGDGPVPKREDMPLSPMSPYAASKVAAEAYCIAHARCFGMAVTVLRYFNVYGPRQNPVYATAIPMFMRAAMKGIPAPLYGDGEQTRDFTYINDAVSATVIAANAGGGGVFNVSSGAEHSINDLLETMEAVTGKEVTATRMPPRAGDVRRSVADLSRIKALGYRPMFNLRKGLEETVAHYDAGYDADCVAVP